MVATKKRNTAITFIDLFAGIGGFHLAFHGLRAPTECVYVSEWDKYARMTYRYNFEKISPELFKKNRFTGDITLKENQDAIPDDVDILCGGFPCQPFSQAGFKKGFAETRGTLFFEIANILNTKKPKAFFLENVRHLVNHDEGKTFKKIEEVLRGLGYSFHWKIVKASDSGLPTYRPRVFMVGFRNDIKGRDDFEFPSAVPLKFTMSDVFGGKCKKEVGYTLRVGGKGSGLHDRRNWDTYLVAGKEKRLTVTNAKMMMGYPDSFVFPVSDAQAMKQLGNSVAVDAVRATARSIVKVLTDYYVTNSK